MFSRLLSMCVALSLGCLALADLKSELASRYKAWDSAYSQNDSKKLVGLLHPQFRVVTGSGKIIARKVYVSGLGKGKRPEVYRTTVLRVEKSGTRALAWTSEVSRKTGGKDSVHRYRDTWTKLHGHWMLLESRTLEEK